MGNKKISELSAAGALTGAELVEIVQSGANVQTTTQAIADLGGGGGGGSTDDKLDALATTVDGGTNYTLQVSDLTLINAGANVMIVGVGGVSAGTLTIPLNATVAFPIGCFIGFRGFSLVAAVGGVTATPTNATLDCDPDDFTFVLQKTATNEWIVNNGAAAAGGGGGAADTDELPEGSTNLYFTAARAKSAVVTNGINNGVTDKSPSEDAVYDALATLTSSVSALSSKQDGDDDLTAIAGLSPANDDIIQRKSGAWTNRTMSQLRTDLQIPWEVQVACSDETTPLSTGTAKVTFRMPRAMTVTAVRCSLTTAQTSGSIFTVDINEGGTSILSTKLTIDNGEETSVTAATAAVISDPALADNAKITIDIDQIGDGTAKGLKVTIIGY